jgi:hypothetical protein
MTMDATEGKVNFAFITMTLDATEGKLQMQNATGAKIKN